MEALVEKVMRMCEEITSLLECDGCGECCRSRVTVLSGERERIEKLAMEKGISLKMDENSMLPAPCPFLREGRCIIYGNRPLVCRIYPFKFLHGLSLFLVAIDECPLASRIYNMLCSIPAEIKIERHGGTAKIPLSLLEKLHDMIAGDVNEKIRIGEIME